MSENRKFYTEPGDDHLVTGYIISGAAPNTSFGGGLNF